MLWRLLRPIFARERELFDELGGSVTALSAAHHETYHEMVALIDQMARRQDDLERELRNLMAYHWDHVATVRRLAALEDAVLVHQETATLQRER
jgi:hypothetical protein